MNKKQFLIFLLLNFGALYIGSLLMGGSPMQNEWYQKLAKAPWTPPGWFFGIAWTIVMITFSFFLSYQGNFKIWTSQYKLLYSIQFILNTTWNYVFFQLHEVTFALVMLLCLLFVVCFLLKQRSSKQNSWTILPYISWLFVATSLNLYPLITN